MAINLSSSFYIYIQKGNFPKSPICVHASKRVANFVIFIFRRHAFSKLLNIV